VSFFGQAKLKIQVKTGLYRTHNGILKQKSCLFKLYRKVLVLRLTNNLYVSTQSTESFTPRRPGQPRSRKHSSSRNGCQKKSFLKRTEKSVLQNLHRVIFQQKNSAGSYHNYWWHNYDFNKDKIARNHSASTQTAGNKHWAPTRSARSSFEHKYLSSVWKKFSEESPQKTFRIPDMRLWQKSVVNLTPTYIPLSFKT